MIYKGNGIWKHIFGLLSDGVIWKKNMINTGNNQSDFYIVREAVEIKNVDPSCSDCSITKIIFKQGKGNGEEQGGYTIFYNEVS